MYVIQNEECNKKNVENNKNCDATIVQTKYFPRNLEWLADRTGNVALLPIFYEGHSCQIQNK